jgi:peptidoglycan hydrolase-like protein with peptidoglycan-binding domain
MNWKFYISFLILLFVFWFTFALDFESECEERIFVVTAYYSPLDGQSFYYKSDYAQEKILNGEGVAGAWWKKVFNWMLAGPSSYPFGSMIYFPWLGVGQIEDRGWAIVHSGQRWHGADRIDIWMGKGEEGLIRALTFGKQTLTGYFCNVDQVKWKKIKVWFDFDQVPFYRNFFDIALWVVKLEPTRTDIWVSTLQKYLIKLGYMKSNKQTWFFGSETKNALCKYQVAKWIFKKNSLNCGVFSLSTSLLMKQELINKWFLPSDLWAFWDLDDIKKQARSVFDTSVTLSNIPQYFSKPFNRLEKSDDIKKLQVVLSNLGHYSSDIDWIYNNSTILAVYNFQLENKILSSNDKNLSSRWWFGPATRAKLNMLVNDNEKLLVLKENIILLKQDLLRLDSVSSSTTTPEWQEKKEEKFEIFQFYRAFKKGDQNWEIRILQKILSWENLYKWKIDWVYSVSVINALCQFQKNNNLWIDWDLIALCGYLWPQTREVINRIL